MHVFDEDPEMLNWESGNGRSTILYAEKPGEGIIQNTMISWRLAPKDSEFEAFLERGKALSKNLEQPAPIFLIMKKIDSKTNREITFPFAEYFDGTLIAFCRPPWRNGQESSSFFLREGTY